MQLNSQHVLEGDNITHLECSKNSEKFKQGLPDTIIIHYTAGSNGMSSAKYLCKKDVKASAHVVIDRSGDIIQLVPFDTISWHAGKSHYKNRKGFNQYSIGIELDNAGTLTKSGDKFQAWFGKFYPKDEVIEAIHRNESASRYWHTYTEAQLKSCYELCEVLIEKYGITTILGHEEIAPGRKRDPGPAFPLDKFRNQLLFQNRKDDDINLTGLNGNVSVESLNIRSGPGLNYDTISNPLYKTQSVEILDERYGWYKVKTEITGWVSKKYIDFD